MFYRGYDEKTLTFTCTEDTHSGDLVTMNDSGTVRPTKLAEEFIGIAVAVRDGFAAVQLSGYIEVKTVNKIEVGYHYLLAISNDTVDLAKSSTTQRRLVVNSEAETIGILL